MAIATPKTQGVKLSEVHERNGVLAFSFFLLLVDLPRCCSEMPRDVREVSGKFFDYIIIGGGTAGCPLAATLSERFNVLLIERGDSPYKNPTILEKSLYGFSLLETDEFSSVAQRFVSGDGVPNLRGRVLGGSSAINGGFYSRAGEDFVKRVGWDEKKVREAYEWVESRVVFRPELTPWQAAAEVGFLEAGIRPYNGQSLEHISGTKIGASIFDLFGRRHSSADLLMAGNPAKIVVLLNTTVKDVIVLSNGSTSEKIARGIRFIRSDGTSDEVHEAYLQPNSEGDVILSAGALGSPQILMLSGIGSFEHLKSFNLPLVLDLKQVGQSMKDNPCIAVLNDSGPENLQPDPPQVVGIADDLRVIVEVLILPNKPNKTTITIAGKLASTLSDGTLELNGTDPRRNPSVRFNYLAREEDVKECVRLAELLKRVERSEAITAFLGRKRGAGDMRMRSEEEARRFCFESVGTFYHYHGGCLVGSVVGEDYKVFGVEGLRVVDGSTLSESPGTNPMATLFMLGRYQGMKILEERSISRSR